MLKVTRRIPRGVKITVMLSKSPVQARICRALGGSHTDLGDDHGNNWLHSIRSVSQKEYAHGIFKEITCYWMCIYIKLVSLAWCHKPVWHNFEDNLGLYLATLSPINCLTGGYAIFSVQSTSVSPASEVQSLELLRPMLSMPGRYGSKQNCYSLSKRHSLSSNFL